MVRRLVCEEEKLHQRRSPDLAHDLGEHELKDWLPRCSSSRITSASIMSKGQGASESPERVFARGTPRHGCCIAILASDPHPLPRLYGRLRVDAGPLRGEALDMARHFVFIRYQCSQGSFHVRGKD